ncbi:hypothetical protein B0T24DRAFT_695567 [Lasiosphaeria ovina]|uniref:Uncharacterized protein n=1 Tax=Lasiosphaeria ovina TaxID=92902 RepID=A0AAE0NDT7_9PEZI|nr:hypothetical protein B0T24DRAFT_695567 [Lasiosphaeria ovina]
MKPFIGWINPTAWGGYPIQSPRLITSVALHRIRRLNRYLPGADYDNSGSSRDTDDIIERAVARILHGVKVDCTGNVSYPDFGIDCPADLVDVDDLIRLDSPRYRNRRVVREDGPTEICLELDSFVRAERPTGAAAATQIPFDFREEIDTELECRLIPVDKPGLLLPNRFRLTGSDSYKSLRPGDPELKLQAGRVAVLAGASGCHYMNMIQDETSFCLPSGKWERVWALAPEDDGGRVKVREGDSGSWVVHPDRGSGFGIAITSTSHTVYLMPLKSISERASYQGRQG